MAVKKVKKKKRAIGARAFSGGSTREQSPLRPKNVEKLPPCGDTCPSGNKIRKFLTTIAQADKFEKTMEQAFGTDFSKVHVHTDSEADEFNQRLSARAFTTGRDIFFRQGEYSPGSDSGRKLIAHELTHTIQQGASERISRAMTAMVTEKTHLRKPNSKGDAPRKLLWWFNML